MARWCCLAGLVVAGILSPLRGQERSPQRSPQGSPQAQRPNSEQTRSPEATTRAGAKPEADAAVKGASTAEKLTAEKLPAKDEIPLWPCEKKLIALANAERRRYGLSELTIDKDLLTATRNHCYWMADARSLQHTTAMVAENIAMGQRSCEEAISSWMASPGHRANMLGSYTRLGMAAYQTSDGTIYWCLQFLR